ncbi:pseudouridine synthase [Hyphomonas sp.]|uniref:pseudouridine synthase n=1 Tax=Hyphomonas sp. TaxID=87 RepID=UPI00391CB080
MSWSKTYPGDEPMRINKWLALEGVCSRREADALLEKGLVELDGVAVTTPGERISKGQTLTLTSGASRRLDNQLSVILNKPVGLVSGTPEPGETPAIRLVTEENLKGKAHAIPGRSNRMAPLGRLDKDSRGLLILSEDGVLAKAIIGPLSEMDKEYIVRVKGDIDAGKIERLRHGLELDGRKLRPAKVERMGGQLLRFTLKEGRNRQIRRMCDLVDLRVQDLQRIRIGPIALESLPEGKWRPLSAKERAALLAAGKGGVSEDAEEAPTQRSPRPPRPARPDGPRPSRPASGKPGSDKPRPPRPGAKPAGKASAKPTGKPGPKGKPPPPAAPSGGPNPLKGAKFRRTKLPPRPRTSIK